MKTVRKLLSTVPPKYLHGIDCVVLTNQSGLSRKDRLGKTTSRKRRLPQSRVEGRYHPGSRSNRPWIELFADNILDGSGAYKWIPLCREIVFGPVLFHEVGHHVEATLRPEFREKEDVADAWSDRMMRNFFSAKYWFLKPLARIAGGLRDFAKDRGSPSGSQNRTD